MKLNQVTIGHSDYDRSVAFYTQLGLTHIVDAPPRYARFETLAGETLSIHHMDQVASPGTIVYFEVEDLDRKVVQLERLGMIFDSHPTDQDWGWREAYIKDPAGNTICLFYAGKNRRFPPWRIAHPSHQKGKKQ